MKQKHRRAFLVIAVVALGFLLKASLYDRVTVQGDSMSPTFQPGERILVSRLAYGLQIPFIDRYIVIWRRLRVGDIVVFPDPFDGDLTVKRCLAVEGDNLAIDRHSLVVSGFRLPLTSAQAEFFRRNPVVPEGTLFTVGDNPEESIDSRHFGYITVRELVGRVPVRTAG